MSPRPYRLGQRQGAAEETRARVLAAARELIISGKGITGFTIDAVARRAGVARMTVYYQFGTKRGLIEAVFDDVAAGGPLPRELPASLQNPDPIAALEGFVAAFGRFWTYSRVMHRRIAALATLDHELEEAVLARNQRRRHGLSAIVGRLAGVRPVRDPEALVDVLFGLTSFAVFDSLAGPDRSPEDAIPIVQHLVRAMIARS
jgi:AcrR family transcriptional regulator